MKLIKSLLSLGVLVAAPLVTMSCRKTQTVNIFTTTEIVKPTDVKVEKSYEVDDLDYKTVGRKIKELASIQFESSISDLNWIKALFAVATTDLSIPEDDLRYASFIRHNFVFKLYDATNPLQLVKLGSYFIMDSKAISIKVSLSYKNEVQDFFEPEDNQSPTDVKSKLAVSLNNWSTYETVLRDLKLRKNANQFSGENYFTTSDELQALKDNFQQENQSAFLTSLDAYFNRLWLWAANVSGHPNNNVYAYSSIVTPNNNRTIFKSDISFLFTIKNSQDYEVSNIQLVEKINPTEGVNYLEITFAINHLLSKTYEYYFANGIQKVQIWTGNAI